MTYKGFGQPLGQVLADAAARLAAAGVPTPMVDAELLAAHVLGVSRGRLTMLQLMGESFGAEHGPEFERLIAARVTRLPLQHLTGIAHFRYLDLAVGPGVFVPRPETETVVQLALDFAAPLQRPLMVDLGTGSGAIAGSLAHENTTARVYAVELSDDAYPYSRKNLEPLGVTLVHGDMREAFGELNGSCDVVVSNPPYIPANAVPREPEAREHDPHMALYGGGADGMIMPRAAEATAARLLRPGGFFVMEHAEVQAAQMRKMFQESGAWENITTNLDLTGRDRSTSAIRRG
ncbi:protein-(glutamine-N5) methyltransferase, release factor-specific [Arthrobacter sp. MYb227]|uniref:peptide chain release factor N(5)-glutamine methyltransferase n=1 Tax=Arthrobacter sp. MYb227 TaxID=1848601 RepID=UPI000CFBA3AF|nr:peptide chain release factor N(5)-glutamine methyltransferase [Arthrobacter sp. MYb227]PQZ86182.1 protein-(glutamine-N5) methyltransferase, release factor-specific [Arthrobacter sp. MYb227]